MEGGGVHVLDAGYQFQVREGIRAAKSLTERRFHQVEVFGNLAPARMLPAFRKACNAALSPDLARDAMSSTDSPTSSAGKRTGTTLWPGPK